MNKLLWATCKGTPGRYQTKQLIMIAIADDDVDDECKIKMMKRLLEIKWPDSLIIGSPKFALITAPTVLELVLRVGSCLKKQTFLQKN